MLRKDDPFFLDIGRLYPRIERRIVSSPLDEMLFNTTIVTRIIFSIWNSVWGDTVSLTSS